MKTLRTDLSNLLDVLSAKHSRFTKYREKAMAQPENSDCDPEDLARIVKALEDGMEHVENAMMDMEMAKISREEAER